MKKKPALQPNLFDMKNPPVKAPVENCGFTGKEAFPEWGSPQQCMACGDWIPQSRSDLYHAAEECDHTEEPRERARIFCSWALYPYSIGPVKPAAWVPQGSTPDKSGPRCAWCMDFPSERGHAGLCACTPAPEERERSPNSDPASLTARHPYKGPGVKDGDKMAPQKWRGK